MGTNCKKLETLDKNKGDKRKGCPGFINPGGGVYLRREPNKERERTLSRCKKKGGDWTRRLCGHVEKRRGGCDKTVFG